MRRFVRLLFATSFVVLIASNAGCQRRRSVVSQAHASAVPAKPAEAPKPASVEEDEDGVRKPGQNARRWRDTGVYLDGKAVGALAFGELPIALKPVWVKDKLSADKEYGTKDPGWRWIKERQYRFTDYLKTIGVDAKRVREIHVVGPRFSETIIASGKDLRSKKGDGFRFRFGGIVNGKALPVVPESFGNGRTPDKISTVMIYIDREPPKLEHNVGLVLDGRVVTDIPYHGEPMRGGVRVYRDDKLELVIKRPLLRQSEPVATSPERWSLAQIFYENGVDMRKVVEAWVVRDEKRKERLTRDELEKLTFEMGPKGKNEIYLGDKKIPAQVLALHTRTLRSDEIPQIQPDEEF